MENITRTRKRETIYDKAERILAEPDRIHPSPHCQPPMIWTGRIDGDHGTYVVIAVGPVFAEQIDVGSKRIACTCPAGVRARLCSHMIVAEELRQMGGEE